MVHSITQDGKNRAETGITGITADLNCCPQQANSAELFEDIGVPEQRSFHGCRFILRLMVLNCIRYTVQLSPGKSPIGQEFPAAADGIWNVVPLRKLRRIFRSMAEKHAKVMHPSRGKEDVVVVLHSFANLRGESIEPRLMSKLVGRLRLGANVFNDRVPPIARRHSSF